jgi:putative ABC transport system permease protein
MVSYISEQRTKEIGIRKIVGASITSITTLLTKEFFLWIFLANLFAWPIAYFTLNRWMQNFAYKINIGLEIFLLSGGLAALIAIITISYRVIKTANLNPVDSLKYE